MGVGRRLQGAATAGASATLLLVLVLATLPGASGTSAYPVLPAIDGSRTLSNLSSPVVAPGEGGSVALEVADPLAVPITSLDLVLQVYEFNAYPGNATSSPPTGGLLLGGGSEQNLSLGGLAPGGHQALTVEFSTGTSAAQGTYAIRIAVTFGANGTSYRFESRGWFSEAAWVNATTLPDGGPTLNLTRLGVSGIVPETGVLVRSNSYSPWLYVLVGGALGLAAAGAYYATRDGPGSRSGARPAAPESKAPRAFGKSRTKDGD